MQSSPLSPSPSSAPAPSMTATSTPSSAGPIDGISGSSSSSRGASASSSGDMQQAKLVTSDSPQPWTSGILVSASNRRATSAASGADDTIMHRSDGTLSR